MELNIETSEKEQIIDAREDGFSALALRKEGQTVDRTSFADAQRGKPSMPSLELVDSGAHGFEKQASSAKKDAARAGNETKDLKGEKKNEKTTSGGEHKQDGADQKNSPSNSQKANVKTELKHFGEGLATGLFLSPINGITQLINHAFKAHIKPIEFKDQKVMEKSTAGKIGKSAGDMLSFAAVSVATGSVGGTLKLGAEGAKLADAAVAGAVHGGILTPSSDQHFWTERLKNAGTKALEKGTPEGKIRTAEELVKNTRENQEKDQ